MSTASFYCQRCDALYTPAPDQWIFHMLCEACFTEFDQQKMLGRFDEHPEMLRAAPQGVLSAMGITDTELAVRPAAYHESSKDWIAAVGRKLRS